MYLPFVRVKIVVYPLHPHLTRCQSNHLSLLRRRGDVKKFSAAFLHFCIKKTSAMMHVIESMNISANYSTMGWHSIDKREYWPIIMLVMFVVRRQRWIENRIRLLERISCVCECGWMHFECAINLIASEMALKCNELVGFFGNSFV